MRIIDALLDQKGNLVSFSDFADEYYSYHKGNWANYFDQARVNLMNLRIGKNENQQAFIQDLILDLEEVIKATASQIPDIITKFTTGVYSNTLEDDDFRKQVEIAFNYSAFRSSAKASWFAERFEIKACLYCNAQFALQIGKEGIKKQLLFQLDHFYNKARLPFLSLTLGNLIPSCSSCNISKSKTEFALNTHIHPYYEDTDLMFDFSIDESQALEYLLGRRESSLLKPKINIIDARFETHESTFHILDTYHKHYDIIEDLILKSFYYNKSKRDELKKEFGKLNFNQSVVDRFVLGNYSLSSEINKRPLAKLAKDIGKQLKILK